MSILDFERRDTFSSLDILERIEELEELTEEGRTGLEDEELADLIAFAEEAETYSADWQDGTILINDEHFEAYIRELIEEVFDVDFDAFPFRYIDWTAAAEDSMYDYDEVTLGGSVFWISNH
jgi:hypothetical protein